MTPLEFEKHKAELEAAGIKWQTHARERVMLRQPVHYELQAFSPVTVRLIQLLRQRAGQPVRHRDIAVHLGLDTKSVAFHLLRRVKAGTLTRELVSDKLRNGPKGTEYIYRFID